MSNENKNISKEGLDLIISEEGMVLRVYKDQLGYLTCGVGHLLTSAEKQSGIYNNGLTKEQAINLLKSDVVKTQNAIKQYIKVELNQNQFDALVSMLFNTGTGPIINGTLGKVINSGNFADVPSQMEKWVYGGGKALPVLQARRKREVALFNKPVEELIIAPIQNVVQAPVLNDIQEVPMPEVNINDNNDIKLKLTPWQTIQNIFLKLSPFARRPLPQKK